MNDTPRAEGLPVAHAAEPDPDGSACWAAWRRGDWHALVALDLSGLETMDDRAELAQLIAAAHFALGQLGQARDMMQLAARWGADRRALASMLVGGIHDTLGRAVVPLDGPGDRAGFHFLRALEMDRSSETRWQSAAARMRAACEPTMNSARTRSGAADPVTEDPGPKADRRPRMADFERVDCRHVKAPPTDGEAGAVGGRRLRPESVDLGGHPETLFVREGSDSDSGVLRQLFVDRQYDFGWLAQGKTMFALQRRIVRGGGQPLIIDAGANIGASALWFTRKFARSVVLAIEPEPSNGQLLQLNCAGHNVVWLRAGLADRLRWLVLDDPALGDWGFRVVDAAGGPRIPCLGVPDLLAMPELSHCTPFILKVDIEGGESLVFAGDCDWLTRIPMIVIELHDWMLPGEGTSAPFIAAVQRHRFEILTRGENLFCFNRRLLDELLA